MPANIGEKLQRNAQYGIGAAICYCENGRVVVAWHRSRAPAPRKCGDCVLSGKPALCAVIMALIIMKNEK